MNEKCALCPADAEFEYAGRNLCSPCVSIEAAKIERPDGPHKKRQRNKGKSIDEIGTNKNYTGEASPYWDDLRKQRWEHEDGQLQESVEANPDVLPESASLFAPLSTDDEILRAEVLQDVIDQLTVLQREVLALCEEPGFTEENAAKKLNMTRRAFRTIVTRIKKTIEIKTEQRKKSSQWQK